MRMKWKKVFIWSSLGSVAVAFAVAVARKAQKPARSALVFEPVPMDCSSLTMRTEVFQVDEGDAKIAVWDEYRLQPTSFKVWNVLDLQTQPGSGNPQGTTIYHVTRLRTRQGHDTREELAERFYGTLRAVDLVARSQRKDQLARGALVEIARCYVGGASNGIETGEVHRSGAPVQEFHFERPGPDAPAEGSGPRLS
jgi:hypothetical protein